MASEPILLSSSPLPKPDRDPIVLSAVTAGSSQLSSSPLPSPRTLIQQLATHKETVVNPGSKKAVDIWEVPEDDENGGPLSSVHGKKGISKTRGKTDEAARGKRKVPAQKATKSSVTTTAKTSKAKGSKKVATSGTASKYFGTDKTNVKSADAAGKATKHPKKRATKTCKASDSTALKQAVKQRSRQLEVLDSEVEVETESVTLPGPEPNNDMVVSPLPARRRQWTPVHDTVVEIERTPSPDVYDRRKLIRPSFNSMLEGMRYSAELSEGPNARRSTSADTSEEHSGLRKRSINMIAAPNGYYKPTNAEEDSGARKTKKAKKWTLTELATEKYKSSTTKSPRSSIKDFFPSQGKPQNSGRKRVDKITQKPTPDKGKKSNKEKEVEVPLLSPKSAKARFGQQDFIFGTSSQLGRCENPYESESDGAEVVAGLVSSHTVDVTTIARASNTGGLWNAGARDLSGRLMDTGGSFACVGARDSDEHRGQDISFEKADNGRHRNHAESDNIEAHTVASNQAAPEKVDIPRSMTDMPDFRTYPTTRLQAELSRFGFKNIKNRGLMITRLEKCWEAQHRTVMATHASTANVNSECLTNDAQPEAPRDSSKATGGSGILESDCLGGGPKKLKKPKPKEHYPEVIDISLEGSFTQESIKKSASCKNTAKVQPSTEEIEALHRKISIAVRSGGYISETSFRIMILFYDPIILEDLTVWLNTDGKKFTGLDGELREQDVKGWCEAQGICCLTRDSQRGLTRKRF